MPNTGAGAGSGGSPSIGGGGTGASPPTYGGSSGVGAGGSSGVGAGGSSGASAGGIGGGAGGMGDGGSGGLGGSGTGGASAGAGGMGGVGAAGMGGVGTGGMGGVGAGGISGGAGGNGSGGRPTVVAAPGATLVKVDASVRRQTFEGWGTSLAWWAYQVGGWSTTQQDQLVDLLVDPVAGLGYSIFRYNIGGGDDPSHDHMGANREMPGFQSESGVWDWNADARQTSILTRLVSAGENVIIEAFSNSPPYFMTNSGCASGSTDGGNNLRDDSYAAFASYLVSVTQHYRDALGITFRTLEPMNEPNAGWWRADGGQEGCHFGASSQEEIIQAVAAELDAQGVTETKVSASDENSMDDAYSIIGGYDSATLAALDQINVHSYNGSQRRQLRELANRIGKRLWQSESGPLSVELATNTDAALFMAGRIIQDLRELEPEAWIEWQVIDPANAWTSFSIDDARQTWTPLKRFYVQAGFSRFIRPGATFIDVDSADMVAALSADGLSLTIVVRNGDPAASKTFTFDLTSLPSLGSSVEVHRSSTDEDLVQLQAVAVQDWSYTVTVPAYSVTTYLVPL